MQPITLGNSPSNGPAAPRTPRRQGGSPLLCAETHLKGTPSSSMQRCPTARCLWPAPLGHASSEAVVHVNPIVSTALHQLHCALIFGSCWGCVYRGKGKPATSVPPHLQQFSFLLLFESSKPAGSHAKERGNFP